MFDATFNNISFILWRSVLLEETGVHGENHWPSALHRHALSHNVASSTQLTTFVVISTECISSCKSNYHTTTTTTIPTLPKETKVKNIINWRLNQNPILTQTDDYRFRRINIKFLSIEEIEDERRIPMTVEMFNYVNYLDATRTKVQQPR